jgi:hypothetical protein
MYMKKVERHILKTHVFKAGFDEHLLHDKLVFKDFAGKSSFFQFFCFALTGRELEGHNEALLNDISVVISAVGDPRIWPLKITRIASCYGNFQAGCISSLLSQRNGLFGFEIFEKAAILHEGIYRDTSYLNDLETGASYLDELVKTKSLLGFGVPFREIDERLTQTELIAQKRDMEKGIHWKAYKKLKEYIVANHGIQPNSISPLCALLLDMQFTPHEIGALVYALQATDLIPNAFEGAHANELFYREVPWDFINLKEPAEIKKSPRNLDDKGST